MSDRFTCPCCGQPTDRPDPQRVVAAIAFGWKEKIFVDYLVSCFGQWIVTDRLVNALWGDRADGGPESAKCHVSMVKLRVVEALRPVGLTIESQRGSGYRMTWLDPTARPRSGQQRGGMSRDSASASSVPQTITD